MNETIDFSVSRYTTMEYIPSARFIVRIHLFFDDFATAHIFHGNNTYNIQFGSARLIDRCIKSGTHA